MNFMSTFDKAVKGMLKICNNTDKCCTFVKEK